MSLVLCAFTLIFFTHINKTCFAVYDSDAISLEWHNTAIRLAENDRYVESLAYFRGACRLNPRNALYWNDLGVTEMRLGLLEKAERRFLQSLKEDSSFEVARENLDTLITYITSEEKISTGAYTYRNRLYQSSFEIKHKVLELKCLSIKEFLEISQLFGMHKATDLLHHPFVVKNILPYFGWNPNNFSLQGVKDEFGSKKIDYYPHNLKEFNHPMFASLKDVVDQMKAPDIVYENVDASLSGTYFQWNMDHLEWQKLLILQNVSLPSFLFINNDAEWMHVCFNYNDADISKYHKYTHWKMMVGGESGSGMFNHKDTLHTASWQLQLQGRKQWHICPPSEDAYMYDAGDIDAFSPDYLSFPKFLNASCYSIVLNAGDMLYYPKDHWHQTNNLDTPTISLSGTLVLQHNYVDVRKELEAECNPNMQNRILPLDADFCRKLRACYNVWNDLFSTNIQDL